MATQLSADQLNQNIQHDLTTCGALLKLLEKEQEALKQRNVEEVSKILDEKVPLLERLESSAQLRQAWATAANKQNSEEDWAKTIEELGESNIKSDWQKLKTVYADVRKQNEINGKLLSRHQKTVTRLLDVMRGKTATPNLYTSSGYSSSQAQGNTIGEA